MLILWAYVYVDGNWGKRCHLFILQSFVKWWIAVDVWGLEFIKFFIHESQSPNITHTGWLLYEQKSLFLFMVGLILSISGGSPDTFLIHKFRIYLLLYMMIRRCGWWGHDLKCDPQHPDKYSTMNATPKAWWLLIRHTLFKSIFHPILSLN